MQNVDQNQMVQHLLTLMSQREKLDKEIAALRKEINEAIATERVKVVVKEENVNQEVKEEEVKEEIKEEIKEVEKEEENEEIHAVTPPPFVVPTPPPFEVHHAPQAFENSLQSTQTLPPPQPTMPAVKEDSERKLGVKWMAYGGIFIAVIGLLIGIKVLLNYDLIGSIGRVIVGYLVSAAMIVSAFKVPKERKVLRNVLVFGGATLAYSVTSLAYGYFDLFSSPITLSLMWLITASVCSAAYIKDKKILFNYSLFAFILSPFFAGYTMGTQNATIFWVIFSLAFNAGLLAIYKLKKWSSTWMVAFTATFIICLVKFFDGYDFSHVSNVLFFFGLCAVFYIGTVILFYQKENFNNLFIAFTLLSLFEFATFSAIEFHHRQSISYTYIILSAVLAATAFFFQKINDKKVLFTTPFSMSIIFVNVALLVRFSMDYSQWFPLVFALEIIATFFVFTITEDSFFKNLTLILSFAFCSIIIFYLGSMDFVFEGYKPTLIVLNPYFLGMMLYTAVVLYIIKCGSLNHKRSLTILTLILFSLAVFLEIYKYWYLFDTRYTGQCTSCAMYVSIFIVLGVVSVVASFIPESVTFLSGIRKCTRLLLMVLIVFFCAWALALLNDVRSRMQVPDYYIWRYLSLLVAFTIIGFIIKFRNSNTFARYHILSDLIAAIAIIKIVSAEIRYLTSISSDFDQNGICITLWFGISALALFLMGFWLKLKHLRILGFVMSGVTVVKLFFYDVWNSELWVKAILFVAVGAIFMLVSFIYTKYLKKDSDEQIVGDK